MISAFRWVQAGRKARHQRTFKLAAVQPTGVASGLLYSSSRAITNRAQFPPSQSPRTHWARPGQRLQGQETMNPASRSESAFYSELRSLGVMQQNDDWLGPIGQASAHLQTHIGRHAVLQDGPALTQERGSCATWAETGSTGNQKGASDTGSAPSACIERSGTHGS